MVITIGESSPNRRMDSGEVVQVAEVTPVGVALVDLMRSHAPAPNAPD